MIVIARIIGVSALAGGVCTGVGIRLFGQYGDYGVPSLVLGCVGAIIGAVAASAGEIVFALRQRPSG